MWADDDSFMHRSIAQEKTNVVSVVPGDLVTIDMWKVSWRSYHSVKQGLYLVTHVYAGKASFLQFTDESLIPQLVFRARLLELPSVEPFDKYIRVFRPS